MSLKTSKNKALVIVFRIILIIVLLEIGLRISGGVHLLLQDRLNKMSPDQIGAYSILALGDSMTFGGNTSWPKQLEFTLNSRSDETQFKVFNKATAGPHSSDILSDLESDLDKYDPNMVIVMMGATDEEKEEHEETFVDDLRIFKLANFLLDRFRGNEELEVNDEGFVREDRQEKQMVEIEENKKAIERDPTNVEPYFKLGHRYFSQLKYKEAEEMFEKAVELKPSLVDTYLNLGWTYYHQKKYDESEEMFKKVMEMAPEELKVYNLLGWAYRKNNKFQEAEYILKKALEIDPNNFDLKFELGLTYLIWDIPEKARETFEDLVQSDPDYETHYKKGVESMKAGRPQEALYFFKQAIAANPDIGYAYSGLSYTYIELGYFLEAEEILEKLNIKPAPWKAYLSLSTYYINRNISVTVSMLQKVIEINPEAESAYSKLGTLYLVLNRSEESIEMFNKEIELNPEKYDWDVYAGLSQNYLDKRGTQEAEEIFEALEKINPTKLAIAYADIGKFYKLVGDNKKAEEMFEKARSVKTGYPQITQENYRKLYKILNKKGIKLVAMQYQTLDLAGIKSIFTQDEDIIFVSNEENFENALKTAEYEEIFKDRVYGSWGHCTLKGNKLIAENVANVILSAGINFAEQKS